MSQVPRLVCFIYQAYSLIQNSSRHFFHLFVGNMLLFFLVVLQFKVFELLASSNEPFLTNNPASTTRTSALYCSICVHIFKAAKIWNLLSLFLTLSRRLAFMHFLPSDVESEQRHWGRDQMILLIIPTQESRSISTCLLAIQ